VTPDVLAEAQRLRDARVPFALATVVLAELPTSGTVGARAIVTLDGRMAGWIGGSCAQPAVQRECLEALADGAPRLLVLTPHARRGERPRPGVVELPMTCASQGELQIFIEPFLPNVALAVIGRSPVARALVKLGALLDFDVCACDPGAPGENFPDADRVVDRVETLTDQLTERSVVVVATIGSYDEEALLAVLSTRAAYVGLVASIKRLGAVIDYLRGQGVAEVDLARVRRPEGLPAKTLEPAEIAFSVMAELLQVRRELVGVGPARPERAATAIDPICGMAVNISAARYTSGRDGMTFYFCAAGCRAEFEASRG